MRALLIGGTGFIGSHLVPALDDRGVEMAVLTRGQSAMPAVLGLTPIIGDRHRLTESREAIRAFSPDVVIDLVLSSARQAGELVDVLQDVTPRVVALSSMDVYRACGVLHGLEEGPLEPVPLTEHSALRTKLSTYPPPVLETLRRVFGWLDDEYDKIPVERTLLDAPGLVPTILRLPMVYGPGDPLHRLWPLVKRMEDGRAFILMSTIGAAWRSPRGFVGNVAAAIALAATTDAASGQIFNVAEQPSYSEGEWARLVADAMQWHGDIIELRVGEMPQHLATPGNLAQHWSVDSTRIRTTLGYDEPFSRDEALAQTITWERAHPPTMPLARFDYDAEDAARRSAALANR